MNTKGVVVVDYGMGNVLSVSRAIEHCGGTVHLTSAPADIVTADRLVLPGVGAFRDCVDALAQRGLIEPILKFSRQERPFLGICVGMQVLFERGEEFESSPGLGLIPGTVIQIATEKTGGGVRKIPHIGWTTLKPPRDLGSAYWHNTILARTEPNDSFYFVHSFTAVPTNPNHLLAVADYEGFAVTAAVRSDNITGCQFHPEKSGACGLNLIEQYLCS